MTRRRSSGEIDNDYDWLLSHLNVAPALDSREELANRVVEFIHSRIEAGYLPYTIGLFGGWGAGKTTLLALLAKRLARAPDLRVIYFNAWKYAGFMEILPSLIYKILRYGIPDRAGSATDTAMKVLLSLGKEHADQFGEWAKNRIGVNPVKLFKEVYGELSTADDAVDSKVLDAYYTQIDKAQDVLKKALGSVKRGEQAAHALVVLIDELDRCDPDEAFDVIKQTRVLFAMRNLPIIFILCANPEPIGLAIKHRYGLASETGDYEARRILEKFVDSYEDLSEQTDLGPLVRSLWASPFRNWKPWIIAMDDACETPNFGDDVVHNATALDVMTTAIPLYSNLRVLAKSFTYVEQRSSTHDHLLWTIWHLEMTTQIDPNFRAMLRSLAGELEGIVLACYRSLAGVPLKSGGPGSKRIEYDTDKGATAFAIFRSYFWEHAKAALARLEKATDPEASKRAGVLRALIVDARRVDFVALLCLLPFPSAPKPDELIADPSQWKETAFDEDFNQQLHHAFAYLLASY